MTDTEYRRLTRRIFTRDGWKCRCPGCKARSGLHCHHIIFRSQGGTDTQENLISLCNHCHDAVHAHNLDIALVGMEHDVYVFEWRFHDGWSPTRRIA